MTIFIFILCICLLLAVFFFLGKLWSSILSGLALLIFVVYCDCTNTNNTRFYCDKGTNRCIYSKNSKIDKNFKEYKYFLISDVKEIKYEENTYTRMRKGRQRRTTHRDIKFIMKDGTKNYFPSSGVTTDRRQNNQTVEELRNFLESESNTYIYESKKSNSLNFEWYWLPFLLGYFIGLGLYTRFFGEFDQKNNKTLKK